MSSKIYVDLDGVLAAFNSAFVEFFGKMPEDVAPKEWARLKVEWPTFWIDLELEKNALDLWRIVGKKASILSAIPAGWPAAATGKQIWCRKMLPKFGYTPGQEVITCMRKEKQRYAKQSDGTPNILIDDKDKNCAEWTAAGGIAIRYIPSRTILAKIADLIERTT